MKREKASIAGVTTRFVIFAVAMVALLLLIVQAIQRPVAGDARSFDAVFDDVSGLRTGADVRMYGVAVGKVTKVDLDGQHARVRFTVKSDRPVYDTSRFAIRFQSLAGVRYIEVEQPKAPGATLAAGATIGDDHTVGSFDMTALFNGMEPALREFSPEAVNQLAVNALAVFQGDGSKVGATLDAIGKLSAYATDRQAVLSLLLRNFRDVADQIGGHSPEVAVLIQGIADVFVNLQKQFDGLMDAVDVAPPVLGPLNSLLATLGLTQPTNPDLDRDIRLLFPDPATALDVLGRLPGLLQSLIDVVPTRSGFDLTCSHGRAELPAVAAVLIQGQRIAVCKPQ